MQKRFLAAGMAVGALLALPAAAPAASTSLVINEIDYDQPSTDTAEFVELKNVSSESINLSGYTVTLINGANNLVYGNLFPQGDLAAGGRYVICGSNANVANCDLDVTPNSDLIQNGSPDAVALLKGSEIVDTVSYEGDVPGFTEGTGVTPGENNAAPNLSISRSLDGCDTDDNSADFQSLAPTPGAANTSGSCGGQPPADAAPSVQSTTPADGAVDVPLDSGLTVGFSEPVTAGASAFSLTCDDSGVHALTVTGGPQTYSLDPAGTFGRGEECTLNVDADSVSDIDGNDPPDTMGADANISFTTLGLELKIREIQGAAHVSPHLNDVVSNVSGVVTARRNTGFFIQDPQPDDDEATSEGLFVFTGTGTPPRAEIAVGKAVLVSGRVTEFRGDGNALGLTQISGPTVTVGDDGAAIPATVIGEGGRVPPNRIIDNDSLGDVDVNPMFDPDEDGIDFYETLEGMKVQVNDPYVVGPTASFGEIPVVGDGGEFAGPFTARGGLQAVPGDFNPERIQLDDEVLRALPGTVRMPPADVRDRLSSVQGVVDYSFSNFKVQVLSRPAVTDGGLEKEVTEAPDDDELSVGSFNVENLRPSDSAAKFAALAHTVVTRMQAPDIIAVEEIQDNNGTSGGTDSPVVDASQTWARLIGAIAAAEAGGPTYDYRQIDPVAHQDGGAPGGNIRVGFLFRTDRGLEFVDRGDAGPTDATGVVATRHGPQLTLSPGRIEPTDEAWTASRKPLAGEFRWRGRTVFAVANHFASKGGDEPLFGHFQPPTRHTENGPDGRHQQAARVNEFVRDLLAADGEARVIVLGDINDFDFSETVDILESGGALTTLFGLLPQNERYSYDFEGNSQVLDQILVSPSLLHPSPEYDSVHMNAEFADQTSDHDPQVARLKVTGRNDTAHANSG